MSEKQYSRKICLFLRNDPSLLNNNIFKEAALHGMKSDGYMFIELKKELARHSIELSTQDILPPKEADFVLYLDQVPESIDKNKSALIVSEPPVYSKLPWQRDSHKRFSKVFSHDPAFYKTDPSLYVHLYYPIDFDGIKDLPITDRNSFENRKLANLVNGSVVNYRHHHIEGSLIGERYRVIEWFGKNHPSEFDFFGRGITKRYYGMSFPGLGYLRKLLPAKALILLANILQRDIKRVYKGEVPALEKSENLSRYRFNFCFENTSNINGYVTEKLFDCFFSKTIPIYWGAPNIKELVPKECFVDYRDFNSLESLYSFMKNFNFDQALLMFNAQQEFLKSGQAQKLHPSQFAQTIISGIKEFI
ncbi:MAG: hypothetical protein J7502_09685 [Flavisolibacter sp.]|nr:hypothetical protein [Flavisolibacter sp.]